MYLVRQGTANFSTNALWKHSSLNKTYEDLNIFVEMLPQFLIEMYQLNFVKNFQSNGVRTHRIKQNYLHSFAL